MIYGGDPNQDGSIDAFDIQIFMGQYGQTGDFLSCDFNGDGSVDAFDVQILAANFGLTIAVPAFMDNGNNNGNRNRNLNINNLNLNNNKNIKKDRNN